MTAIDTGLQDLGRRHPEWKPWLAVVQEILREAANPIWESLVPARTEAQQSKVPLLAGATVAVIEKQFTRAAVWCFLAAALSVTGLMHSYRFITADTAVSLTPAWPWVYGYLIMGGCFFLARWLTVPSKGH